MNRALTSLLGGILLTLGLQRRSRGGAVLALAGGVLLLRGIHEHSRPTRASGIGPPGGVERSITIHKPSDELYHLFREPRTLSYCLKPVTQVTARGPDLLHWKLGRSMEFDTRFVEDHPGELLRWESLEGGEHQGSVRFHSEPGHEGTVVTFRLHPPGDVLDKVAAKAVARWILARALRRFKHLAEAGESPGLAHA